MIILRGYINGVEVRFDFTPPNKYTAYIPANLHGRYIVQLHATDEAGNSVHFSDVEFIELDLDKMVFTVLPYSVAVVRHDKDFVAAEGELTWVVSNVEQVMYTINSLTPDYTVRIL